MKGLLIKDFKLLTRQKSTALIMLLLILVFPFMGIDAGFVVSYTMLVVIFMTVSTVSYDDFDKGMSFLLTLPITRKKYVLEKYVLGLLAAVVGWVVAVGSNMIYLFVQSGKSITVDFLLPLILIFPVGLIMWEFYLPVQLKFGAEKARLVLFIVTGVLAACVFVGSKIAETKSAQIADIMEKLSRLTPAQVGAFLFTVAVAGLLISFGISAKILENKEY